jgi:hypothetical protein
MRQQFALPNMACGLPFESLTVIQWNGTPESNGCMQLQLAHLKRSNDLQRHCIDRSILCVLGFPRRLRLVCLSRGAAAAIMGVVSCGVAPSVFAQHAWIWIAAASQSAALVVVALMHDADRSATATPAGRPAGYDWSSQRVPSIASFGRSWSWSPPPARARPRMQFKRILVEINMLQFL